MSEKQEKRSIFDAMNEYLEEFEKWATEIMAPAFSEGPNWNTETCCLHALSSVFVTPREVIVTADLPSIKPETLKVEAIDENTIEITAKMKKKVRFTDLGIYHRQGEFSSLSCQDRIHVAFNVEKMKISWKGGILEVRFPRKKRYQLKVE
ncbi:MAG TPA: Hsp20/alpha crystallin family protein [Candidatus Bathyarchaeota archaeon]|nr:Hsp20/alpha crystallin family protein [Candidatus Bathyarchaeota archaeon]